MTAINPEWPDINPEWPDFVKQARRAWRSSVVARSAVPDFTGQMVNKRSLANEDSQGRGPKVKIVMGPNKVGYEVNSFCDWWASKCTVVMEAR